MALHIYEFAKETSELSSDGTYDKPLFLSFDGRGASSLDKQLFVRNDNIDRRYTDISIVPISGSSGNLISGVFGYEIKLAEGNKCPTPEEWGSITPGNTLTLTDDIGTTLEGQISVYLPFWIHIVVPGNQPAMVIRDIGLRITATEYLI